MGNGYDLERIPRRFLQVVLVHLRKDCTTEQLLLGSAERYCSWRRENILSSELAKAFADTTDTHYCPYNDQINSKTPAAASPKKAASTTLVHCRCSTTSQAKLRAQKTNKRRNNQHREFVQCQHKIQHLPIQKFLPKIFS